jgi:hypothetical protein
MKKSQDKGLRNMKRQENMTYQKVNNHTTKVLMTSEEMKPQFLSSKE